MARPMGRRKVKPKPKEDAPQPMSDARLAHVREIMERGARVGIELSHSLTQEVLSEIDRLRAEISRYDTPLGKESIGPHRQPKDCPSWYDHCHCTVQNFFEKAKDNERLRAELAAKDVEIAKLKYVESPSEAEERRAAEMQPNYFGEPFKAKRKSAKRKST